MANMFSLILSVATLVSGLLWFLDKFIYPLKPDERQRIVKTGIKDQISGDFLKRRRVELAWLETMGSVFPVLAVVLIIRSFIYEPFQIPSGSMMPTLLIGDFIIVEKFSYGIKDPIYQKLLIKTGHPKRGDIVVFKYPNDTRLDYIKRVVGLPGDKITYDSVTKELTVQPKHRFRGSSKSVFPIIYSNVKPSNFVQTFPFHNGAKVTGGFFQIPRGEIKENGIRLLERKETLGDITHCILTIPIFQDNLDAYYQQPGQRLAVWIVPVGQYFMMGDNRDNSADSRYWGFVPEVNLVGKATAIWMSIEKQEGKWPTGIRLNRIGRIH